MTTIVAVSDLHLDARCQGKRRFEEIARALHQAKDEAIRRRADLFVCAGDIGDPDSGSIVYPLLALCIHVAIELDRSGILQAWVKGNHDGEVGESLFTPLRAFSEGLENMTVCEEPSMWEEGRRQSFDVLALPHGKYDPAKWVEDFGKWREDSRTSERLAVIISHLFPIEGLEPGEETNEMPRGGPIPFPYEAVSKLAGPVLVLSGHYHKRQLYQVPGYEWPPVPIQIIGSIATLTHGEESNGEPGFLVIEV